MFRQLSKVIVGVGVIGLFATSPLYGQFDDGSLGGPIDPGTLENQIFDAVEQGGGVSDTGATGTTGTSGGFNAGGLDSQQSDDGFQFDDLFDFGNFGDASQGTTNERDFPFVGVTTGEVPERNQGFRHVGPVQESFGSSSSSPASSSPRTTGVGRGGGFNSGGGSRSGFEVQRPSNAVRSRILPRFSSQPVSPSFVSNQVSQRFNPDVLRQSGVNASITVQGRTAVISGVATDQHQARILNRRLRLEPGISRVRSQVEIQR